MIELFEYNISHCVLVVVKHQEATIIPDVSLLNQFNNCNEHSAQPGCSITSETGE